MGGEGISIRRLTTANDYHACEAVQRAVWDASEVDVVPLHLLITLQKNGGLVLGAFDEAERMIGFLVGFLGVRDGDVSRPKHCSHMMGVLDETRGQGIGYRLKCAQREHVLNQGLDLVTWTYDPLESLNAALNVGKLGVVCSTYIRDLYGPMTDGLNAGLATDRFQVDWWIGSGRVAQRLEGRQTRPALDEILNDGMVLNPAIRRTDGLPAPVDETRPPTGERIAIEIPARIQAIKAVDPKLALRWRAQTRELFEACFAADYAVTEFVSESHDGDRRSYYVLEQGIEVT
jgi:predicted GNAT superfamily acetyltransferase